VSGTGLLSIMKPLPASTITDEWQPVANWPRPVANWRRRVDPGGKDPGVASALHHHRGGTWKCWNSAAPALLVLV
jgi:hypothetical protein